MSAKRIYMDHDMLEGYANYNEAADSCFTGGSLPNGRGENGSMGPDKAKRVILLW